MYQKEIIYMSLFHDEVKQNCVGYLKLEKKQGKCWVELQVKNVLNHMAGSFPVRLQDESGWREEGMLALKDGNGQWTGSTEAEVMGAEIILQDSYRIKGQSKRTVKVEEGKVTPVDKVSNQQLVPEIERANQREQQSMPESETIKQQSQQTMSESPVNTPRRQSLPEPATNTPELTAVQQKPPRAETKVNLQKKPFRAESAEPQKKQKNVPLYENKWEQLLTAYEQIHPYGDDRVYVKLEPKDFIVLRSNYQHLVNNSFLLHGFYNYRYLILGKEKDYYLGVPGVFYEREKMVALMFGFEAFECEGGEAEEGKFGYYLRKVEL